MSGVLYRHIPQGLGVGLRIKHFDPPHSYALERGDYLPLGSRGFDHDYTMQAEQDIGLALCPLFTVSQFTDAADVRGQ
jgi:hypothetical protein